MTRHCCSASKALLLSNRKLSSLPGTGETGPHSPRNANVLFAACRQGKLGGTRLPVDPPFTLFLPHPQSNLDATESTVPASRLLRLLQGRGERQSLMKGEGGNPRPPLPPRRTPPPWPGPRLFVLWATESNNYHPNRSLRRLGKIAFPGALENRKPTHEAWL